MPITVIYDDKPSVLPNAEAAGEDLWLSLSDLTASTQWEMKPEGLCRETICIPVSDERRPPFLRGEGADTRLNLAEFARLIEQPFAHGEAGAIWYFGRPSWEWTGRLSSAVAPEFSLPDFDGKLHSLSDYRGKKVFLLCWASWCSCRFDLPVWSALREELKDQNFELITVACESKGREAALGFVETADPSHPALLDEDHLVPELYITRNVPAAFWIDEQGSIVRANDPIYAQRRKFENGVITEVVTNERYLDAVREWVAKGPEAHYVRAENNLKDSLGEDAWENQVAMAYFRLGVYLYKQGLHDEAVRQFKQAHDLQPDNWNYKRQAWNLGNLEEDYGYKSIIDAIRAPDAPRFYRQVPLAETPI